jgi:hypothetical protein
MAGGLGDDKACPILNSAVIIHLWTTNEGRCYPDVEVIELFG